MRAPITPLVPPYHPQAAPLSGYGDTKIGTFVCIYWFYTEVAALGAHGASEPNRYEEHRRTVREAH